MKGKMLLFLKRNSSTILSIVAGVGVIATAILTADAVPKAEERKKKAEEQKGEPLTVVETIVAEAPVYVAPVVVGASTVACILGANVLNRHQQAALTSAYALLDRGYKQYSGKVKELFGEEADIQIRDAIAMEDCSNPGCYAPGCGSIDIDSGDTVTFYDEHRKAYFESTMAAVINAEYHLNRNFSLRGYTNLNEFYEMLGLSKTRDGEVLGWNAWTLAEEYETQWIDFDHRKVVLNDGMECYIISFPYPPSLDYEEY